ncbi:Uncharacterised protein r2_g3380 [Pycnogonum litorale]
MVDYATKYVECVPLNSIDATSVADALIHFFAHVGIPRELVSDQGTSFVAKLQEQLCDKLGIKHIVVSSYHPQASGHVEIYNGIIKKSLKKLVETTRPIGMSCCRMCCLQ